MVFVIVDKHKHGLIRELTRHLYNKHANVNIHAYDHVSKRKVILSVIVVLSQEKRKFEKSLQVRWLEVSW